MDDDLSIRVYYEDTDAGGVVYHANYLGFMERARTEMLVRAGISIAEMQRQGTLLTISHADIKYIRPAVLGDVITVHTAIEDVRGASVKARHSITRDGELLVQALITIVCVNPKGRPIRLPEPFRQYFSSRLGEDKNS